MASTSVRGKKNLIVTVGETKGFFCIFLLHTLLVILTDDLSVYDNNRQHSKNCYAKKCMRSARKQVARASSSIGE